MTIHDTPRHAKRPADTEALFLGNVGIYDCWILHPKTNPVAWVGEDDTHWVCSELVKNQAFHPQWCPEEVARIYNNYTAALAALRQ